MKISYLFKIIILSIICTTLYILYTTLVTTYPIWLDYQIKLLHFERQTLRIKKIFTTSVFEYFKVSLCFILIIQLLILYFSKKIFLFVSYYFRDFASSFQKMFVFLFSEKIFFVFTCIPIVSTLYFGNTTPISYDEAWTYLQFSKNGFLVSLSYYPAPNNHVFHSLMTNFFHLFLSDYPKLVLRMPVVIISIFSLFISFYSISKHFHKTLALFVTALYPMLSMSIYYSYESRGYALVLLLFIISFHFVLNINQENKSRDWVWFSICSILGFFTMPSFLYIFIILNVIILLQYSKEKIINQLKYGLITVVITLLLYAPIIIFNGFEALSSNRYVAPISRIFVMKCLPNFFKLTLENIFGFHFMIPFLLIVFTGLIFLKLKEKKHLQWYIVFFTLPIILLIVHAVLPFYRTYNYFGFVILFLFGISISIYLEKIKTLKLLILLLLSQIILLYNYYNEVKKIDDYAIKSTNTALQIKADATKYRVYSSLFETYLFYHLKTKKHKYFEIKHQFFTNVNSDTIHENGYIIIDKAFDQTVLKKPIIKNKYYNVYVVSQKKDNIRIN